MLVSPSLASHNAAQSLRIQWKKTILVSAAMASDSGTAGGGAKEGKGEGGRAVAEEEHDNVTLGRCQYGGGQRQ